MSREQITSAFDIVAAAIECDGFDRSTSRDATRRALEHLLAAGYKILPPRPRWRHRERGTTYTVVASARVQASNRPIFEGDVVAVYVGDDDGWYVRETGEFTDGRFEQIEETVDVK